MLIKSFLRRAVVPLLCLLITQHARGTPRPRLPGSSGARAAPARAGALRPQSLQTGRGRPCPCCGPAGAAIHDDRAFARLCLSHSPVTPLAAFALKHHACLHPYRPQHDALSRFAGLGPGACGRSHSPSRAWWELELLELSLSGITNSAAFRDQTGKGRVWVTLCRTMGRGRVCGKVEPPLWGGHSNNVPY